MSDVVVCGPSSWNHIVYLDDLPEPRPHAVVAQAAYETLGATSAGKALHLTDLGRPVELHTRVGDDELGDRILSTLQSAGVPTVAQRVPGQSERHLNLMTPHGERLTVYLSVLSTVTEPAVPPPAEGAKAFVLDLAPWTRQVALRQPPHDVPVWTDLHDYDGRATYHRPFIDAATYVFLSADALAEPTALLHHLIDDGVSVAVCTLGAQGAVAVDRNHQEWTVEPTAIDAVVDTNGAGDAFFAGTLHATLDGAELIEALRAGSSQAVRALESPHLSPLVSVDGSPVLSADAAPPAPTLPGMTDLDAVEDRIWGLLDRYCDELEEATIYGMPSLRWPGSGSHDYFAAVKRSARKVSLYAIAVDTWPQALEGSSEEFRKRRTGKATFSFPSLDDELAAELEAFLARLYRPYREHHRGRSAT